MIAVFAAILGHWRRRPLQLAAAMIGLILATALWSGVQALNDQARRSYDRAAALIGAAAATRIERRDGQPLDWRDFAALRRAGWPATPLLAFGLRLADKRVRVVGIDIFSPPPQSEAAVAVASVANGAEGIRDFLSPPYLALASPQTINGLSAASRALLPPLRAHKNLADGVLVLDIGAAHALQPDGPDITTLLAPLDDRIDRPPLTTVRDHTYHSVSSSSAMDLERLTDSFHLNLTAFGFLAFWVGLFITYSAIGLAFEQRLPIFRSLRAIGVSARRLAWALGAECVLFAIIAAAVGLVLGFWVAAMLLPGVSASLKGLYAAEIEGNLRLSPRWLVLGIVICVGGALLTTAQYMWRVATTAPLMLGHVEMNAARGRSYLIWRSMIALMLMASAVVAANLGDGLLNAFFVVTVTMLTGALLLPGVLALILAFLAKRAKSPIFQWVWADARQQMSALSLALTALLLALSASIGVGAMVESFRGAFTHWLDQKLAAEIYVTPSSTAQERAIVQWLTRDNRVTAVTHMLAQPTRNKTWPIELLGLADHRTYRETWPLLETENANRTAAWDRLAHGDAVFASEQYIRRFGVRVGDAVAIAVPTGIWRARIIGVYADYGNPIAQLTVSSVMLRRYFPAAPTQSLHVRADPARVSGILDDLRAEFGLTPRQAIDQAGLKAFSNRAFNATFVVTDALSVLTLGVAGVALFIAWATLSGMRLGQLAPIWALGVERRRLERLELLKAVCLSFFTAIFAIPLGVFVAWLLVAYVNVEAFGWRLPLRHFPLQWASLLGIALAIAALAAAPAIWRLRRAHPADLIRVFSNER
jgi:putative ABC transport system permease protein